MAVIANNKKVVPLRFRYYIVVIILLSSGFFALFPKNFKNVVQNKIAVNSTVKHASSKKNGSQRRNCAPRNGVVVMNLLGLMANNLFEVAFANRMASELCWGVVYRNAWISVILEEQAQKCFPEAMLPPPSLSAEEAHLLNITDSLFEGPQDTLDAWAKDQEKKNTLLSCEHGEACDFTKEGTDDMLEKVRNNSSQVQVLYLKAFFIHHGWIPPYLENLRRELTPHSSCCKQSPPEDSVVIHIRDFERFPDDEPFVSVYSGFYKQLLEHYDLTEKPIWIVCQPETLQSLLIKNITGDFPNAHVTAGADKFDAFCILTKARTLILSHKSTFSQFAALLAGDDVAVHYPIFNNRPFLTLGIQSWKYHLVNGRRDGIREFDFHLDKLEFRMDWETDEDIQRQEVGSGSDRRGWS